MLAFISVYFFESSLFNELRAIQTKNFGRLPTPRIRRKLAVNVQPFPSMQVLLVARRETRFSPAMRRRISSILKVRKKLFELSPSVRFRRFPLNASGAKSKTQLLALRR